MDLKQYVPSIATLGNAAAGFAACALAVTGRPGLGALMILGAVLMDSLDGALARSLNAVSEMGAELDSLADVISFGVAPALLAGSLLPPDARPVGWLLVTMYPLCAAWRLARYNVAEEEASDTEGEFIGLPSTGAGGASATAVLLYMRLLQGHIFLGPVFLPAVMALLGALMVSRITYKHAGDVISRLHPALAVFTAVLFVAGTILWEHEFLFAAMMWIYVAYAPLLSARVKIHALRHA